MFGVNLSDRLKAIASGVDAAGTALQARAIGQPANGTSRPTSPTVPLKLPSISSSAISNPAVERPHPESPTRTTSGLYAASTSALAENALSGLRKSFNFAARPTNESHRPAAAGGPLGPQEMRDFPATPSQVAGASRPSSPAAFLRPSTLQLGSELSSLNGTPLPLHSPFPMPDHLISQSSPSTLPPSIPVSDATDPATYPLPPSPILSSSPIVSVSSFAYADPLGASPVLESHEHSEPPISRPRTPPPMAEKSSEVVGLGVLEVEVEIPSEIIQTDGNRALEGSAKPVKNGVPVAIDLEVEQKLAAADRRYEGTLTSPMTQTSIE